jgi:hypothetical protein
MLVRSVDPGVYHGKSVNAARFSSGQSATPSISYMEAVLDKNELKYASTSSVGTVVCRQNSSYFDRSFQFSICKNGERLLPTINAGQPNKITGLPMISPSNSDGEATVSTTSD